jgi:hypothetical protein
LNSLSCRTPFSVTCKIISPTRPESPAVLWQRGQVPFGVSRQFRFGFKEFCILLLLQHESGQHWVRRAISHESTVLACTSASSPTAIGISNRSRGAFLPLSRYHRVQVATAAEAAATTRIPSRTTNDCVFLQQLQVSQQASKSSDAPQLDGKIQEYQQALVIFLQCAHPPGPTYPSSLWQQL